MKRNDIAERVRKVVVQRLGVCETKVLDTSNFIPDLGADSLDTVELIMAFEDEFDCDIPDDAVWNIMTVKDAVDLIGQNG